MANALRTLVSKKKVRYQEGGFDLDLTYITDRVIAMGFPSTGMEGVYRNPLPMVQKFFNTKHEKHYKVYNLCSERAYDINGLFHRVECFGFDDHNPCPVEMLGPMMESLDRWLAESNLNVAGIHCKAGKGRTGLVISAYLLHSGVCQSAEEALHLFGSTRTRNGKGVTIPSQMRYVHYYEQLLRRGTIQVPTYQITHVRFIGVPNFDVGGGCDPYFVVDCMWAEQREDGQWVKSLPKEPVWDYKRHQRKQHVRKYRSDEKFVDLDCSAHNVRVRGNVKLTFYDEDVYSADDKMCHFWFHTGFIENNYLCFDKSVIDKACKDKKNKHFDPDFKVEIFLHRVEQEGDPQVMTLSAPQSAKIRRDVGAAAGAPITPEAAAAAAAERSGADAGSDGTNAPDGAAGKGGDASDGAGGEGTRA